MRPLDTEIGKTAGRGRPPGKRSNPGLPALRMPGVDDRLATPEAGEEYIDGVRYEVMAGEPEHADPLVRGR